MILLETTKQILFGIVISIYNNNSVIEGNNIDIIIISIVIIF